MRASKGSESTFKWTFILICFGTIVINIYMISGIQTNCISGDSSLVNVRLGDGSPAGKAVDRLEGRKTGTNFSQFATYMERIGAGIRELNAYTYSRAQMKAQEDQNTVFIEDVFIGLKSTRKYHNQRLDLILETWRDLAISSVHLITDGDDPKYSKLFGNGTLYINTKCGATHKRQDLVCKLQVMYDRYMAQIDRYKWFCSVDDDSYVNIPNFVKMLRSYDPDEDWYIGKPSLNTKYARLENKTNKIYYRFATGGAAICISRGLAKRMQPLCGNGGFIKRAEVISDPDDTTIGYVCNYLLKVPLTVIPNLHSHLESMWMIDPADYHKQISISWGEVVASKVVIMPNRLLIRKEIPQYSVTDDPTRAFSLHCHLFPDTRSCSKIIEKLGPMAVL